MSDIHNKIKEFENQKVYTFLFVYKHDVWFLRPFLPKCGCFSVWIHIHTLKRFNANHDDQHLRYGLGL